MIFDPATAAQLKPWLVRTLEPICDAEPGALADYILALLKHNVAEGEMRKELTTQLEEFLEKECPSFIDTLFTVLRTKSYLPYAPSPPPTLAASGIDMGIPIPLDGLISPPSISSPPESSRKRSIEHDDYDSRGPSKGPRLNADGQFSRHSNGRGDGRGWRGRGDYKGGGDHGGGGSIGGEMDVNGGMGYTNGRRPQAYRPPDQRRGVCRDYHNNGYCARGALCKYSHGDDAVVPGRFFPPIPGGMPFMPIFPGAMPFDMASAYDPHQARMDMRPTQNGRQMRAPLLPRIQQEDGKVVHPIISASGELPVIQDLTPQMPQSESSSELATQPMQSHMSSPPQNDHAPQSFGVVENFNGLNHAQEMVNTGMDVDMVPTIPSRGGGFRGRGYPTSRGRGGVFAGEVHNFQRPERRKDKTLVVEKIPADKLSLDQVNGWFKQFGTVTNVAVDAAGGKALVSFSTHDEAHAAWKSEEAVFNNRFVKVFWHRPMEGQGQVGNRMLAASAPLVANIASRDALNQSASAVTPSSNSSATPRKSATTNALAVKQHLLEAQIAEQKSLMTALSTASTEEKKVIMARLRKLGEEMTSKSPSVTPSTAPKPSSSAGDSEQRKKELLDKELEMLNTSGKAAGETTDDLKAKLEKLKAEAASLGIAEQSHHPSAYTGYRPYRGRGRGTPRGYYRGAMRGGPPRTNMKLDNRPKKLLIKGIKEDDMQALRSWYETTGQLESAELSEDGAVVNFRSRAGAEQGFAKGQQIPSITNAVQISWYPHASVHRSATSDKKDGNRQPSAEPDMPSPHLDEEEEVVASGWGGYGDGEDGMGML